MMRPVAKLPPRANRKARSAARRALVYSLDTIEDHEIRAMVLLTRRAYRAPHKPGILVTKVAEDDKSVRRDLSRGVTVVVARQGGKRPRLIGAIRLIEDRGA